MDGFRRRTDRERSILIFIDNHVFEPLSATSSVNNCSSKNSLPKGSVKNFIQLPCIVTEVIFVKAHPTVFPDRKRRRRPHVHRETREG